LEGLFPYLLLKITCVTGAAKTPHEVKSSKLAHFFLATLGEILKSAMYYAAHLGKGLME